MKVTITEVFCEILTGLATSLVVLTWLDWLHIVTFEQAWIAAKQCSGFATLAGVLIVAYLVGVVLDAFGLVFDSVFGNLICGDAPLAENIKGFWTTADDHVLGYRDNVWAYYFCYRNLFILVFPAVIASIGTLWRRGYPGWTLCSALALIALGVVLFFAMRTLLKLYYQITKSFVEIDREDKTGPQPNPSV